MPPPAISQALTALIPSLPASNKPFPPALISQCESLLALSRQRASHLKSEEEIARAHACCEIACKRLRAQLRLPAIKNGAGAPCKPKVYTKLITYLEGALADAPLGSLTPKGRKRDASGAVKESGGSARISTSARKATDYGANGDETPSKKRTVDKTLGSSFTGKIKNNSNKSNDPGADDKAPNFVMPSIRNLCKLFATTSMVPHIYTGTCVVLEQADMWPLKEDQDVEDDEYKSKTLALVLALYLMVLTRMRKGNMTKVIYKDISSRGLKSLGLDVEDAGKEVEAWVSRLNEEGWCNGMDWWDSVPEDVLILGSEDDEGRHEVIVDDAEVSGGGLGRRRRADQVRKSELEQDDPEGVLLPGLGTMLHDGVDFTSEDRRLDYQEWKNSLLRRMAAMEKTPVKGRRGKAVAAA